MACPQQPVYVGSRRQSLECEIFIGPETLDDVAGHVIMAIGHDNHPDIVDLGGNRETEQQQQHHRHQQRYHHRPPVADDMYGLFLDE